MSMTVLHAIKGRLLNHHLPGPRPDIFLFSTPRSGSTFLMEILSEQPGMKIINEPLQLNFDDVRASLGWENWEEATTAPDRRERFAAHFDRIRKNKLPLLNRPPYRRGGKFLSNRITFKILHGGEDMVEWFEDELGGAILVLVRHPIPTAHSHYLHPRTPHFLGQKELADRMTRDQARLIEETVSNADHFQLGVIGWCVQNMFFTRDKMRENWTIVSYEDLTLAPQESVDMLVERLDLDPVTNAEELAQRPSLSTRYSKGDTKAYFASDAAADRKFLVEKWLAKTSPEEIAFTRKALDVFQIDMYRADDPYPQAGYAVARNEEGAERVSA